MSPFHFDYWIKRTGLVNLLCEGILEMYHAIFSILQVYQRHFRDKSSDNFHLHPILTAELVEYQLIYRPSKFEILDMGKYVKYFRLKSFNNFGFLWNLYKSFKWFLIHHIKSIWMYHILFGK